MAEAPSVTIPDKPAFKASEVCELAQIQPYVLRSWESEFPELGLSKTPGGPRIYRRTDVERVLRIRDLVFIEGLTLSGVRRRFDAEQPPPQDDLFSFVAEVQAAQAKAAQANAERRTLNADAEPPPAVTPNAERRGRTRDRRHVERRMPKARPALVERRAPRLPRRPPRRRRGVGRICGDAGGSRDRRCSLWRSAKRQPVPAEARAALVQLKQEMRSLLDLLGGDAAASPARRDSLADPAPEQAQLSGGTRSSPA